LCRRRVVAILVGDLPANNLSVEWKSLQHDVEAAAVLVRKDKATFSQKSSWPSRRITE
jgi:hypothetical protein